jgi:hypothetical protein
MFRCPLLWSAVLLAGACSSPPLQAPDLEVLYERAARFEGELRNPVVVIPGVLGSRLVDEGGRLVWGAFTGDFAEPDTAEGARLIALPMQRGTTLAELRDNVRSDGALETIDVSLFGLPYSLKAYHGILRTLGAAGYLDKSLITGAPAGADLPAEAEPNGTLDWGDQHFTCFQFDYDWRRSIPENAAQLSAFLDARAAEVRAERERRFGAAAGREAVHFDLVTHSLGGLIARWYLMYGADQGQPVTAEMSAAEVRARAPKLSWAGAPKVDRCILVAPPNMGSAGALNDLVFGMDLGRFAADYPPYLLGTLPVAYQLLPSAPGSLVDAANGRTSGEDDGPDVFDPALWRNLGWGLSASDIDKQLAVLLPDAPRPAARREIAREHQAKCLNEARRVRTALLAPADLPQGLRLLLFAGDAEDTPTRQQYLVEGAQLWTHTTGPGDGTVSRVSALADQRFGVTWTPRLQSPIEWTQVTFVLADHLGLTDAPEFVDNLLYQLLEAPMR